MNAQRRKIRAENDMILPLYRVLALECNGQPLRSSFLCILGKAFGTLGLRAFSRAGYPQLFQQPSRARLFLCHKEPISRENAKHGFSLKTALVYSKYANSTKDAFWNVERLDLKHASSAKIDFS